MHALYSLFRYHEIIDQLMAVEKCIGRALSLRHKLLPDSPDDSPAKRRCSSSDSPPSSDGDTVTLVSLINDLLSSGEVVVDGAAKGVAGQAILRLFDRALQVSHQGNGEELF